MYDIKLLQKNIENYLKLKNMSMALLSSKSGLGQTYIKDILNGKVTNPGVFHIAKIADVMEISVDKLIGRSSIDS